MVDPLHHLEFIYFFRATYVDSKLQGNLKPTAGNDGTIITVEDLFYNMTVRKKALRSSAEEYQKIAEVVSKYAIHNSHIGKIFEIICHLVFYVIIFSFCIEKIWRN